MINILFRNNNLKSRIRITSDLKKVYRHLIVRENQVKINLKMNEAFLRYDKGNETFDFTFRYVNPELNLDRLFNTVRKTNESIKTFLTRIDTNIEKKTINKKKKKQKKNPEYVLEENVDNVGAGRIILTKRNEIVNLEESCTKILDDPVELKIHILGIDYEIKFNAPEITNMLLPECLMAGFPAYPRVFESVYTNMTNSQFTWYKKSLKNHKLVWEKIGNGTIYTPTTSDIGYMLKLKCVPVNERLQGPEIEIESNSSVQAGPGRCPFEDRHEFTKEKLTGKK